MQIMGQAARAARRRIFALLAWLGKHDSYAIMIMIEGNSDDGSWALS